MKDIGQLRHMIADLQYSRAGAIQAIDMRDDNMLRNKLLEMKRKIAAIEGVLEEVRP